MIYIVIEIVQTNTKYPKMSDKVPFDEYESEGSLDKLLRKSKDNPLFPIGNFFNLNSCHKIKIF